MPYANKRKLRIGLIGLSLEAISKSKLGLASFPTGQVDPTTGQREWEIFEVEAFEDVREKRDVIVTDNQGRIKEHTPVELSYQVGAGPYQRVTDVYPLPVTAGSKAITHITIEATASGNTVIVTPASGKKIRVHYYMYSNKHTTLVDVGMRFGTTGTIKHRAGLAADGGTVNANLIDANWEGAVDELLYANLAAAYSSGVYFTVGYTEE